MRHSGDEGCGDSSGGNSYVMSAQADGSGGAVWSRCSNDAVVAQMDAGRYTCLKNHGDLGNAVLTGAVCGNGIVEGNEECDCLFGDCQGTDPCCEASKCRLFPNADCSAKVSAASYLYLSIYLSI
jgi:hypothetical protein